MDRIRTDIEYDVNLKVEPEVSHLHDKIDALRAELLKGLEGMERNLNDKRLYLSSDSRVY